MSRLVLSALVSLLALPAFAQSWTHSGDRATAPPSIAGDATGSPRIGGFEVICHLGDWYMFVFSAAAPNEGGTASTITVDGTEYTAPIDRFGLGDVGLGLNQPIIAAMKSGSRVEIAYPSGIAQYRATFSLRGSSRALSAVEAACAYPTPQNTPQRFFGPAGESTSDAVALAQRLLADRLQTMRQEASKPDIDVIGAWTVRLDDGWQFLKTDVGPSNFHFGISQFGTVVFARPPGRDWQQILWLVSGATVSFDIGQRVDGWPNIVLRNVRGVNQPYALWTWNGGEYVFNRTIEN
jgi:hypothetical protein